MKYLKNFKIFESDDESIELVYMYNASTHLKDRGAGLKEHIETNDLDQFKLKVDEILKYPEIFKGHGFVGDNSDAEEFDNFDAGSNLYQGPDGKYKLNLDPVWPFSLDVLMYELLRWCIQEGADSFVEYLLNAYDDYTPKLVTRTITSAMKMVSKMADGTYSKYLRAGYDRCINVIKNKMDIPELTN